MIKSKHAFVQKLRIKDEGDIIASSFPVYCCGYASDEDEKQSNLLFLVLSSLYPFPLRLPNGCLGLLERIWCLLVR